MQKIRPDSNSNNSSEAARELEQKLPGRVHSDADSLFCASVDNLRLSFLPEKVIRVQVAEEVGVVLKLANKYGIYVTTRGAGSSATGSAVPVKGGWVLDLADLKHMRIDPVARIATVGTGVITADLQAKVEERGLFFPPDPSSKMYSTIGGNVACNAGGMRCVKYGVTRDYVLGLEGFFANGEAFNLGLPLKKYVSGLNLRDLLIGSEGTLGVITTIHLKLILKPSKRWTGMFGFKSETGALKSVVGLFRAGLNPSILEFLDRQSVACTERFTGKTIFADQPKSAILLIELDGRESEVLEQKKRLLKYVDSKAIAQHVARNERQAEKIWQLRSNCSQSMFSLGDTKLNEDVVVPIERQADLIRYTIDLNKEIGLATPTFGHAGDGNLHVHIMYNRASRSESKRAREGIKKLMRKVVDLGGTITGEHGIGLAKVHFMPMQHSKAEITAMQAVKEALDPKNILNPGKIFGAFEVWDHEPVEVKLPWDHS